jgi:uncharacterized small protein (DUF1192 family)
MGRFNHETKRGEKTRNERTNARGKAKGAKVARVGAKIEAQISYLSHKIERAEAQRNARKAKRNK